jgi:hypothetical protein
MHLDFEFTRKKMGIRSIFGMPLFVVTLLCAGQTAGDAQSLKLGERSVVAYCGRETHANATGWHNQCSVTAYVFDQKTSALYVCAANFFVQWDRGDNSDASKDLKCTMVVRPFQKSGQYDFATNHDQADLLNDGFFIQTGIAVLNQEDRQISICLNASVPAPKSDKPMSTHFFLYSCVTGQVPP